MYNVSKYVDPDNPDKTAAKAHPPSQVRAFPSLVGEAPRGQKGLETSHAVPRIRVTQA